MRLQTAIVVLLAFLFAPFAAESARAQDLLPQKVGNWTVSSSTTTEASPLPAGVAKETGYSVEVRDYTSGDKSIHVVLQKYRDPTSAYEGYTAQLNPDLQPSSLAITSAVARGKYILALVGNYILKVEKPTDVSASDLRDLITPVDKIADKSPYPPIANYLPDSGMIEGTQRYALGPEGFKNALDSAQLGNYSNLVKEVGFDAGAEAMVANFHHGHDTGTLVVIIYPTPQLAEQHLHHLESVLPAGAADAGAKVERRTALLSLVLQPSSPEFASALRKSVNYETQVVWNEPTHSLTDPPWVSVLKTIFMGTFVFCGVALGLGIAFGGFRIIVKRLFPGKVFDRADSLEVLQLGLTGKPIDPKDFY